MRSLRGRLVAAISLVALASVAVAFGIGAVLTRRTVERSTLEDVAVQADLIAQRQRESVSLPCSRLRSLDPLLAKKSGMLVCAPVSRPSQYLTDAERARVRAGEPVDGTVTVDDRRYFRSSRLVRRSVLTLVRPTVTVSSSWKPHVDGLLVGALAAAALASLAALLLARAFSQPIRDVAAASRRLVTDESPPLVPVKGASELASLAESFNDMARQLGRARAAERDFLLSVSHELKTPLTAIRGFAEGIDDDAVDPREAAEVIRREAERLERLVRDLLELARARKSSFEVRREPIDLGVAAREAARRYAPQARAFGVELEAAAAGPAPAVADSDRVLQVVSNLVENALRLTPPGGEVRIVAGPGTVVVEDTGPGLQADELDRAFERFFLYSRYGGERPVGTGLGLAIVKELTQSMGGTVEVESEPGRLTRFTVRLPQGPQPAPGPQPGAVAAA